MKKLFTILLLTLIMGGNALALTDAELDKLASKSKTEYGMDYIWDECANETKFTKYLFSKRCKCAIKSGKAYTNDAAEIVFEQCAPKTSSEKLANEFFKKK